MASTDGAAPAAADCARAMQQLAGGVRTAAACEAVGGGGGDCGGSGQAGGAACRALCKQQGEGSSTETMDHTPCPSSLNGSSGRGDRPLPHSFKVLVHTLLCKKPERCEYCAKREYASIRCILTKMEAHCKECPDFRPTAVAQHASERFGCVRCEKWKEMVSLKHYFRRKLLTRMQAEKRSRESDSAAMAESSDSPSAERPQTRCRECYCN